MTTTAQHAFATVSDLVAARARASPERSFLHFDDAALTYGELDRAAHRRCHAFAEAGIRKGDTVGVVLDNGPDAVVSWVALARLGAVEVPITTALRGDALAYPLRRAACRTVFVAAEHVGKIEAVRDRLPALERILVVDGAIADRTDPYPSTTEASDVACVLFSSGTTGPAKGVVHPHSAGFALAQGVVDVMGYGPGDVLFNAFPLSHVNARFTTVLAAMLADARVVLHAKFSATRFWDVCRAQGVTAFNFMGVIPVLLLEQAPRDDDRDHPVRRAYGAGAAGEIADRFAERFGVPLVETYGSTELGLVSVARRDERRLGSCGLVSDDYVVEIHDAAGRPLPVGDAGEIVVRPRRPGVMFLEYLDDPAATVAATRGLWFHTGDRGRFDADGWLYFVDRMKDVIRRRGENVSSWDVERALESHPDIAEACVVGVPDDVSGEEVLAAVVARVDADPPSPDQLLRHCEENLPYYAIPRFVRFLDVLPRNASSRLEKYRLRDAAVTADTWDREAHGFKLRR